MTPKEFLRLGYTKWKEAHWSIAPTYEQAKALFDSQGLVGEICEMCFPTNIKNSTGFFAWWIGIEDGSRYE